MPRTRSAAASGATAQECWDITYRPEPDQLCYTFGGTTTPAAYDGIHAPFRRTAREPG